MNTPDVGAMHIRTALILCAITAVLAVTNILGFTHLNYWLVATPAIYAWARASVFRLISDATYHAHHRFDSDVEDHIQIHNDIRMNDAVTLDAEKFLRELNIADEKAGRA